METIWKQQLPVHWANTDISGKLSLSGLGQLLINTATQHAENLNFGYEELKTQNMNWVLFRMNIELKRLPEWNEPITLTTWPEGYKGLVGLREFVMNDKDGNELCNATSEWMIIDLETRRPKRLTQFEDILKFNRDKKAFTRTPLTPSTKGTFKDLFSVKVRHSDMDLNGHVTARRYFDWMDDGLYQLHKDRKLEMIQVTFFSETYFDDEIFIQTDENKTTIRGVKKSNGKVAFMAVVQYMEK